MNKATLLPEAPGMNLVGKYGTEKKLVLNEQFSVGIKRAPSKMLKLYNKAT